MLNHSSLPCKCLGIFPALFLVEGEGNSCSTNISRQLLFYLVVIYIPKTPCPNKGTDRTRTSLLAISLQVTAPHTVNESLLSIWLMAQKDHRSWDEYDLFCPISYFCHVMLYLPYYLYLHFNSDKLNESGLLCWYPLWKQDIFIQVDG